MTEHVKTKRFLRSLASMDAFTEILNSTTMSKSEKEFMRLFYIEKLQMLEISERLNISESKAKKMHGRLLDIVRMAAMSS